MQFISTYFTEALLIQTSLKTVRHHQFCLRLKHRPFLELGQLPESRIDIYAKGYKIRHVPFKHRRYEICFIIFQNHICFVSIRQSILNGDCLRIVTVYEYILNGDYLRILNIYEIGLAVFVLFKWQYSGSLWFHL